MTNCGAIILVPFSGLDEWRNENISGFLRLKGLGKSMLSSNIERKFINARGYTNQHFTQRKIWFIVFNIKSILSHDWLLTWNDLTRNPLVQVSKLINFTQSSLHQSLSLPLKCDVRNDIVNVRNNFNGFGYS